MSERWIETYYDEILSYCFHHTGDRQTAEDLCQDTFVSFLEHREQYRGIGKMKNYLYTIARNKCIDYHRKNRPDPVEQVPETGGGQFDEQVEMQVLLSCLSEEQREVIILRYYQGLKYREIAGILGIGIPKAKYIAEHALNRLRNEVTIDE